MLPCLALGRSGAFSVSVVRAVVAHRGGEVYRATGEARNYDTCRVFS